MFKCSNCAARQWIDTDNEPLNLDEARCLTCGWIGALICEHTDITDDLCKGCGRDFIEQPLTDEEKEGDPTI